MAGADGAGRFHRAEGRRSLGPARRRAGGAVRAARELETARNGTAPAGDAASDGKVTRVRGRIGRSVYLGEVAEYDFQPRAGRMGRQRPSLKIFEMNPRFAEVADLHGNQRPRRARGRDRAAPLNAFRLSELYGCATSSSCWRSPPSSGCRSRCDRRTACSRPADETLVIITPHNEAIRYEFARGFRDWYKARTGKTVRIDWRVPGGTTEIARYLASEYQAPFENHWRCKMQHALDRDGAEILRRPHDQNRRPRRRQGHGSRRWRGRAFLDSDVGIGIDLFFGGGSFDFVAAGGGGAVGGLRLHPGAPGVVRRRSATASRRRFRRRAVLGQGRRVVRRRAVVASASATTTTRLERGCGVTPRRHETGTTWPIPRTSGRSRDGRPKHVRVGGQGVRDDHPAADRGRQVEPGPAATRSGTRQTRAAERRRKGGTAAMRLIQKMGANTRYFTDSAPKIPIDVADGDAAIGMAIDFYGRFQAESTPRPAHGPGADALLQPAGRHEHRRRSHRDAARRAAPRTGAGVHGIRDERGGAEAVELQGRHARRPGEIRAAAAADPARIVRAGVHPIIAPTRTCIPTRKRRILPIIRNGRRRCSTRSGSSCA